MVGDKMQASAADQVIKSRIRGVVAVDLDGTLLPDTTVSTLLGARFGDPREIAELERAYLAGDIANDVFAERSAGALRGVSLSEVAEVLRGARWLNGITAAVEAFHDSGLEVVLASITWAFAGRIVAHEFGLDAVCGSEMGIVDGVLDGNLVTICLPADKAAFAVDRCRLSGLTCSRLAALGDSHGDLPLFAAAGLSVAVNGSSQAVAAAHASVRTCDLRDVVPVVRSYFSGLSAVSESGYEGC